MIALAALLLAASQPPPSPAWLAGDWVRVTDASREDDRACTDEESKAWRRDGSFDDSSTAGSWRLNGARLVEIDDGGEPHRSLVRRLGPDRMLVIDEDGDKTVLARCHRR